VEGFEETDRIQRSFCKKALSIPTRSCERTAKLELGRENTRGKILSLAVKYSCRVRQMNIGKSVRVS